MSFAKFFGFSKAVPDSSEAPSEPEKSTHLDNQLRVLNVGGNNKAIPIPGHYAGWEHLLLDIDPVGRPDVLCDARELDSLEPEQFDAVYCSHNLEHYYHHEVSAVLHGFRHVLKPYGFAEIYVPDIKALMQRVVANDMDIEDIVYVCGGGPIRVRDILYGWGKQIEESGVDFFAHKTGFSPASLQKALEDSGFNWIYMAPEPGNLQIGALAFKCEPTPEQRALLGLG